MEKWAWTWHLDQTNGVTTVSLRLEDPGEEIWSNIGDPMIENVDDQTQQLRNLLANAAETLS